MTLVRASSPAPSTSQRVPGSQRAGRGATSPTSSVFGGGRGGRRNNSLREGQGRAEDSVLLECLGFSRARSPSTCESKRAHLGMAQACCPPRCPQPQPSPLELFFRVAAGREHWPGPCLDLTLAGPGSFTTEPRHPLFHLHPPSPPGRREVLGTHTPGIPSLPDSSSLAPLATSPASASPGTTEGGSGGPLGAPSISKEVCPPPLGPGDSQMMEARSGASKCPWPPRPGLCYC